jgi:hypothetical protein
MKSILYKKVNVFKNHLDKFDCFVLPNMLLTVRLQLLVVSLLKHLKRGNSVKIIIISHAHAHTDYLVQIKYL